jgi:hypothetical protein
MVGLFVHLRALFLVAGKTHFGLSAPITHFVDCGVDLVARSARHFVGLVCAAHPQVAFGLFLVAAQTSLVSYFGWCFCFLAEGPIRFWRFAFALVSDVACALAVATGTGRSSCVRIHSVRGLADRKQFRGICLVVANGALGVTSQHETRCICTFFCARAGNQNALQAQGNQE